MKKKSFFIGFFSAFVLCSVVCVVINLFMPNIVNAKKIERNLENILYLDLKDGRVVIRMLPEIAPKEFRHPYFFQTEYTVQAFPSSCLKMFLINERI